MHKRVMVGVGLGALLGLVCILGATLRSAEALPFYYLLAFWFNRVLMGFLISLIRIQVMPMKYKIMHGLMAGTLVSFAFYSSTNFQDLMGFLAGLVYGVIIVLGLHFLFDNKKVKVQKD
jgi:hypothetical protein